MATNRITVHFDNRIGFQKPVLFVQGSDERVDSTERDDYGVIFSVAIPQDEPLVFKFLDQSSDDAEADHLYRVISPAHFDDITEVWCRSWNAFVYTAQPSIPEEQTATAIIEETDFTEEVYISETGGKFGLGASMLKNGGVLFGLFHPHAARVYVAGDFNDWQYPGAENENAEQFLELKLYSGFFDVPNIWLLEVPEAEAGQTYRFYVEYAALAGEGTLEDRLMPDPYSRYLGESYERNDSLIVDPSQYEWHDADYPTPLMEDMIFYELHVHGFTFEHDDVEADNQGKYAGIIDRLEAGYFDKLGITCLYLMPIAEVPTPQGEKALGYNSSLFMCLERDYGSPDDFRKLVDTAHQHGKAVILDEVFNHAANSWNPLWKFILDHPDEAGSNTEGGLYFSGASPWGNRMATERFETQNMLIDTCKLLIQEYHVDGFRLDATHTHYMDHGFLHRLADELQTFKPGVLLIAENLPNQSDLNRQGFDGFAQWSNFFHDALKAFLREGKFEGIDSRPENLGDMIYFSKGRFAAHTNNVINYVESHDEHSVSHEVSFSPPLASPQAKDRKSRLGLFTTMVALGQPMVYMGQELGVERERNTVYFEMPPHLEEHGFYQWASRLMALRTRYPGLRLYGYNPIEDGQFNWLLGPWMNDRSGGGKRVLGWRSTPTEYAYDRLVVLLNFENHAVDVDVNFGLEGHWVRIASIGYVNDIPPAGSATVQHDVTIHLRGTMFKNFVLPDSSGFIYKWEAPL